MPREPPVTSARRPANSSARGEGDGFFIVGTKKQLLYPAIPADPSQRLKALETLVALVVSTGERAATISAVVTSLLLEALTARGIVPAQGLGEQWCDLKQLPLVL